MDSIPSDAELLAMSQSEFRDLRDRVRESLHQNELALERKRSEARAVITQAYDDMRTDTELVGLLRKQAWKRHAPEHPAATSVMTATLLAWAFVASSTASARACAATRRCAA